MKITVHLIIIRGNSGSGKSTIAKRIQQHLGEGVMLIGQDEVRRQMLNVHDRPGNLAIQLIKEIVDYGINHCDYVILEGILNRHKYGTMLNEFFKKSNANVHVYYFDLPFQETVRRHYTKQQTDFDDTAMSKWFVPKDTLNVQGEKYITESGLKNSSAKIVPKNSIVIALAGQGTTRGKVARTRIDLTTNQSLAYLTFDATQINPDYVFYFLETQYENLRQISSGSGTRGGLNLKLISNYEIPIPPLAEQQRIVTILDKFDALTTSLTEGLPREIALRQQQYEYYRELLLSFPKAEVADND